MSTLIELPLSEFDALRDEIKRLKDENGALINQNHELESKNTQLLEKLKDIEQLQFFERVFHWKKSIN